MDLTLVLKLTDFTVLISFTEHNWLLTTLLDWIWFILRSELCVGFSRAGQVLGNRSSMSIVVKTKQKLQKNNSNHSPQVIRALIFFRLDYCTTKSLSAAN